mmetsp:Transcript_15989/g.42034  ORF Transcript_15989/g.42034 Transcript_15989/m.42034 type:complete len:300 (-) Transcript_15989:465-1364(-)
MSSLSQSLNRRLAKLRTETLHYVAGDTDSEYDRTSSSDLIGRKRKWGLFTWCCSGPGDVHTDANDILDGAFEDDPRYSDSNMNPIRPDDEEEEKSSMNGSSVEMVDTATGTPVARPSAQSIHEDEKEFESLTSAELALDFTKAKVQRQRSMSEESFSGESLQRFDSADTAEPSEMSVPDWLREQREELEVAKKELTKIENSIADAEKRNEGKCLRSKRNMKRMQNLKSAYLGMLEEVMAWEEELFQGEDPYGDDNSGRKQSTDSMSSFERRGFEEEEEVHRRSCGRRGHRVGGGGALAQ